MIPGIIGKKIGMTQIYNKDGNTESITLLEAGPCTIVQVKTEKTDGYNALQVGYGAIKEKAVTQPLAGHFKKQGTGPFKMLREFRVDTVEGYKAGDVVMVGDLFKENTRIKVRGTSKGCGFAGGMKRHNFSGSAKSHGAEKVHRRPMSAGATDAARVFKGKRAPGHMGDANVTVRNLMIVKIDAEKNLVAVRGSVPGKKNSTVVLENLN